MPLEIDKYITHRIDDNQGKHNSAHHVDLIERIFPSNTFLVMYRMHNGRISVIADTTNAHAMSAKNNPKYGL